MRCILLKNKTAIITGSNRGIGKILVKKFAENAHDIWACARQRTDEFENFLSDLSNQYSVNIQPIYFDLSDEEEIKSGMQQIIRQKRKIDVLINNAGIAHTGLLTMTPLKALHEVYQINVFAPIQIMQLVARTMMRQRNEGGGCIINMCSVGGIEANPGYLAYGSSKAALIWITRSISKELGKYNIRVNGIAPGLVDTDMGMIKSEEERKKVIDRTSLNRIANPEEIAEAALYIASDAASYMTGHIMVLDGGRL